MKTRKVTLPGSNAIYNGQPAPGWNSYTVFKCGQCKRIRQSTTPYTTGYGIDKRKRKVCFECCGAEDRREMLRTGKGVMYLTEKAGRFSVNNWPGTLTIAPDRVTKGRHNIAGSRYDVWFTLDGHRYHGVNYGENSQILRVKRIGQK